MNARDELVVNSLGVNSVLVFPRLASGDVAPSRSIVGAATGMDDPFALGSSRAAEGAVGFVGPVPVFFDGLESGDTSAWSSTVQ
jgi:hypothetical protein